MEQMGELHHSYYIMQIAQALYEISKARLQKAVEITWEKPERGNWKLEIRTIPQERTLHSLDR